MSVRVMTWVWEQSRSTKTDRLVLLAIADCAADDGSNAYPSMAELVRKTGLTDRGVQKAIARLVELGELVVGRNSGPKGCNRYRVVMPTPEHRSPPPPNAVRVTPERRSPGTVLEPSIEPSVEPSPSSHPTKDIAIPDRIDVEQICRHLADRIEANGSKRPTITKAWRDAARRLIDRDGRTVDQITRCIDWCQDDQFWRSNILSMPKLREKYDQLRLTAQRSQAPRPSTTDQRVNAALELAARYAAEEAS